jgi:hypothetical protein
VERLSERAAMAGHANQEIQDLILKKVGKILMRLWRYVMTMRA